MRWLATYIRGHTAFCLFRSSVSSPLIIHSGVPQGSVISPSLLNYFTSDFPLKSPSFADYFNLVKSSPDLQTLTTDLNADLKQVEDWADSKNLVIAPNKSNVTLFTPDSHQHNTHLQVFYKGDLIALNKNPRNLGSYFDPQICYNVNAFHGATKVNQRNQIIKALSGSTFGQCKETLLTTYKLLVRPVLELNCPI
jgi:hypothetical protein